MSTSGAFSDYSENNIVRALVRNTAFPAPPANVYVALFTTMPAEDNTGGVEVAGNAYARQAISTGASGTGVGSGFTDTSGGNGTTSNVSDIVFPVATGNWGTVVGIALMDASSNGNMLWYSNLSPTLAINQNDQFKILATNLSLAVD